MHQKEKLSFITSSNFIFHISLSLVVTLHGHSFHMSQCNIKLLIVLTLKKKKKSNTGKYHHRFCNLMSFSFVINSGDFLFPAAYKYLLTVYFTNNPISSNFLFRFDKLI